MPRTDPVLTVAQMQAAEQELIDRCGETVESLMERAGAGIADWVWRLAGGRTVTILCGPGNNGGDGYVAGRRLLERGCAVTIVAPLEPRTAAAVAARERYAGPVEQAGKGGVLVDCLFGSGLRRPLDDATARLLVDHAATHHLRIAVDLPSGIDSDSGAVLNPGLPHYDLTLALGAWKFAHWLMPASAAMGERRLVDIGVGDQPGAARLLARPKLRAPAADAHKYTRGLLGIVGGTMPGASLLAARAAMRAGAGYVKLFAAPAPPVVPDALVVEHGPLAQALEDRRLDALLVGPGLGRDEPAAARLRAVLARDLPTVLDGDALVLLAPGMLEGRRAPLVLTPHAGELQSLCASFGIGAGNRLDRVRELARTALATVVAKGPDTLVCSPSGELLLAPPASSWLSAAGTGDVLAGIAASRLATGEAAPAAAAQAVWLHGEAARLAGPALMPAGLIAALPAAIASCL